MDTHMSEAYRSIGKRALSREHYSLKEHVPEDEKRKPRKLDTAVICSFCDKNTEFVLW
jgi:hypothetical protein